MTVVGHLINGQITTEGERTQDVYNPSTGEVSKQVALASQRPLWKRPLPRPRQLIPNGAIRPAIKRARVMFKFKDLAGTECR